MSNIAVVSNHGVTNVTTSNSEESDNKKPSSYQVVRATENMQLDGDWSKTFWQNAKPLKLTHHTGRQRPKHFPLTHTRLAYDDEYIYVIFRVEDQYVRAISQNHGNTVWKDSCVEFFFTPCDDVSQGYFNLEMNCGGLILIRFQNPVTNYRIPFDAGNFNEIKVFHSMPKIVDPEITEPTTWVVEYQIPYALLEKFTSITKPEKGAIWKANLYKCADESSHPHWLTWSYLGRSDEDFHAPEYFGTLEFL